ncbi:MAG TPA: hypothetical protein PKZ32_03010 [Candidatus Melainabacteria bacterium]|nr:hypothetical protein [Candidatus Melainabacteria bacterium]
MNSPDTSQQIQALEASIEKLLARPAQPGDATSATLAAQMMQKDNLQKDLLQQVRQNQDQMIRDQMEQARLRSEIAYKEQAKLALSHQEQTQRDSQLQARLRQEQIQKYEQQQAKLKQEQAQRVQQDQDRRRQEQMQREQQLQARLKQEQLQREQQLQARLKQEQAQRDKARLEQMQKERAQQEKLRQEQHQKELLLAQRLKEERERVSRLKQEQPGKTDKGAAAGDKKAAKLPKTPEQLAKDEEARAFSARTEMSLTSIAFCSPLMLFGMGAAMSIFDNFAGNKKNPALLEARKKNQQQMELSEYARRQADKKFNEMMERNSLSRLPAQSDNGSKALNESADAGSRKAAEKAKEKAEKARVNRFIEAQAAESQMLSRKNDSLEVKKLWKERQRLLENLERVRGQGSLALVSKLVSQLETLDRSLKRLGCDPQA